MAIIKSLICLTFPSNFILIRHSSRLGSILPGASSKSLGLRPSRPVSLPRESPTRYQNTIPYLWIFPRGPLRKSPQYSSPKPSTSILPCCILQETRKGEKDGIGELGVAIVAGGG